MKKSWVGRLTAICVLAVCAISVLLLGACGDDKAEKYTYSKFGIESDNEGADEILGTMTGMYDTLYKDSTLKVTDSKITWDIKNVGSQSLQCKKDGDKYVLSGEYCETMEKTLAAAMPAQASVEWYGIKTDAGYEIVMQMKVGDMNIEGTVVPGFTQTMKFSFVKA